MCVYAPGHACVRVLGKQRFLLYLYKSDLMKGSYLAYDSYKQSQRKSIIQNK